VLVNGKPFQRIPTLKAYSRRKLCLIYCNSCEFFTTQKLKNIIQTLQCHLSAEVGLLGPYLRHFVFCSLWMYPISECVTLHTGLLDPIIVVNTSVEIFSEIPKTKENNFDIEGQGFGLFKSIISQSILSGVLFSACLCLSLCLTVLFILSLSVSSFHSFWLFSSFTTFSSLSLSHSHLLSVTLSLSHSLFVSFTSIVCNSLLSHFVSFIQKLLSATLSISFCLSHSKPIICNSLFISFVFLPLCLSHPHLLSVTFFFSFLSLSLL